MAVASEATARPRTQAPVDSFVGQADSLSGKSRFTERNDLPDKESFVGHTHLPDKRRERQTIELPDKERRDVAERRGWIEYAKRGTKNPKRYAYRRRWKKSGGKWVKSESTRLKSIPPLTEEDYVKRITSEGRNPTTGRRKRDRGD